MGLTTQLGLTSITKAFVYLTPRKLLHKWVLLVLLKHLCSNFHCQIQRENNRTATEESTFPWMIDSGFGRGTTRAGNAQETPTQSHISPSILVYEDQPGR